MTNETSTSAQPPKKSGKRWITPVLALVAAAAIGLFGGVLIGHNTASAATGHGFASGGFGGGGGAAGGGGAGSGGAGGFAGRGGFTSGTIASIDGSTITLTLADGSTEKVTTTSTTTVSKTEKTTLSGLATGDKVTVIGPKGSDGSVTATAVSEGGALGGGFRGGARAGGGAGAAGSGSGSGN